MDALFEIDDRDVFQDWIGSRGPRRRCVAELTPDAASGLRFAFYGRTSTAEYQDPVTSRAWQREVAESVIAGRGEITVEFMDVGWSREVDWARRPQAAALLVAARRPRRSFDAVVVGEYERGFTARQFLPVAEQLGQHGVRVWLPEADGPVDPGDPTHRALVTLLGAYAKREVVRARHRSWRRCGPRRWSRADSLVVVRRMDIGWWMRGRIRIGRMRRGVGGVGDWTRIPRRRRMCGGCSRAGWRDAVWRALLGS